MAVGERYTASNSIVREVIRVDGRDVVVCANHWEGMDVYEVTQRFKCPRAPPNFVPEDFFRWYYRKVCEVIALVGLDYSPYSMEDGVVFWRRPAPE